MDFKLLGSILLIVGTSIGAGMLALPIATAQLGFYGSLLLLFACWFVMTAGAYFILEVNLWMPTNSNLITMAQRTLGPVGQVLAWILYFLLLYSVICAYIAGGSDLLHNLLLAKHIDVPLWVSSLLFTLLFGGVVLLGVRAVDYVNRGLMFMKLLAFFLLILLLLPYVASVNLAEGHFAHITSTTAIMVTIVSFGYAAIVPSLRIYFAGDVKKLKKAIFYGSLIPLVCYVFWDIAIMGIIPLYGESGLMSISQSSSSTSDMVNILSAIGSSHKVTFFIKLFTSICVVTSFLGCSLCLADFLADGLQVEKKGRGNIFIHLLVFLPPLVIVVLYPSVFIKALAYAGVYCVALLMLLPAWMAWNGRYRLQLENGFTVPGGRPLLGMIIVISLALIISAFFNILPI